MRGQRFCCICCEYKSSSLFYIAPENRDGLSYQCKECLKEHFRELNKKKGYYKKYYYKKKNILYPLPTPQTSPQSPAPIHQSSHQETSQTSVQPAESRPVYSVSFD